MQKMLFKYGVYRLKIHYRSKVVFVQSFSYLTTKNDRPIFLSNTVYRGVTYFKVDVTYFKVAHLLSTQREERAETTLFVFHLTVIFLNYIKSTTTK